MSRKKKTGRASEQDRADVLERRQAWRDSQAALEPAHLVFIDKTWAKTTMARAYGRAPRGRRLHVVRPYSPDLNPIEMAFSKLKAFLKRRAARSVTEL